MVGLFGVCRASSFLTTAPDIRGLPKESVSDVLGTANNEQCSPNPNKCGRVIRCLPKTDHRCPLVPYLVELGQPTQLTVPIIYRCSFNNCMMVNSQIHKFKKICVCSYNAHFEGQITHQPGPLRDRQPCIKFCLTDYYINNNFLKFIFIVITIMYILLYV